MRYEAATTPTEAREGTGSRMSLLRDAQALHEVLPLLAKQDARIAELEALVLECLRRGVLPIRLMDRVIAATTKAKKG